MQTQVIANHVVCRLIKAARQNQQPVRRSTLDAPWGQPQPIDYATSPTAKQRANRPVDARLPAAAATDTDADTDRWASQRHSDAELRVAKERWSKNSTARQLPYSDQNIADVSSTEYGSRTPLERRPSAAVGYSGDDDWHRVTQPKESEHWTHAQSQHSRGNAHQQHNFAQPSLRPDAKQQSAHERQSASQQALHVPVGTASARSAGGGEASSTMPSRDNISSMQSAAAVQEKMTVLPAKPYATEQSLKVNTA